MTPLIATFLLLPKQDRPVDRSTAKRGVPYGSADADAERREASP
jgi:hypothetical protein